MIGNAGFDTWPERYEEWFTTPIGKLVLAVESSLVRSLVSPDPGERVLDAGCGTGIFTSDFVTAGARVTGIDISLPMLEAARDKMYGSSFSPVQADMRALPFRDGAFDTTVSITALEFVPDARGAIAELFRVTRPGGAVFVATLNSRSPWADRRRAKKEQHILQDAIFRSADDLLASAPWPGVARTAVHFNKDDDPREAALAEERGRALGLMTGAFVAVRWHKP